MHVRCGVQDRVAIVTLDRPQRKNALTFEMYAELRDWFAERRSDGAIRAVVLTGAGNDFCSGGDVRDIIGPLTRYDDAQRLAFATMTGDLVKKMRACPQPIVAAVDGVCAGAGAILAMACDLRYATARARVAFLFARVGLGGCDMGACALLPRIVGLGHAAELLYTARSIDAETGRAWGFFNDVIEPRDLMPRAMNVASALAQGPSRAHAATKRALLDELHLPLDEAIDREARAQAELMAGNDFRRAYEAFIAKRPPAFEGD